MIPLGLDGLLPVQRRLLLGCHTVCRNEWKKTAEVLGQVMGKWHPHNMSESSMEGLVNNGFVDGSGQWGMVVGTEPMHCAAMRYTKVRANKSIEDSVFRYINDVPWIPSEEEMDPEPIALPTPIPLCLVARYETEYIAFGFKTSIPCYDKDDLKQRLIGIVEKDKKQKLIRPKVEGCNVIGGDYKNILTKGSGSIQIQGKYSIDKVNKKIIVNGWSPRIKFQTLLKRIDRYNQWNLLSKKDNDIGWIDQTGDGDYFTRVEFKVAKQRNVTEIFDKMVEAVTESLKDTLKYNIHVINKQGELDFNTTSIDSLLLDSYDYFGRALLSNRKNRLETIKSKINECTIIEKIRPHISIAVEKYKSDPKKACAELSKLSGVNVASVEEVVTNHSIRKLMTIKLDKDKMKSELKEVEDDIKNIDTVVKKEYLELL